MRTGRRCHGVAIWFTSTIASIETADGHVDQAFAPMAVTVRINDEIDISRGDMLCRPNNQPTSDRTSKPWCAG